LIFVANFHARPKLLDMLLSNDDRSDLGSFFVHNAAALMVYMKHDVKTTMDNVINGNYDIGNGVYQLYRDYMTHVGMFDPEREARMHEEEMSDIPDNHRMCVD